MVLKFHISWVVLSAKRVAIALKHIPMKIGMADSAIHVIFSFLVSRWARNKLKCSEITNINVYVASRYSLLVP